MKRTQQRIWGQAINKTIAKLVGVVKNYKKTLIWNEVIL